MSYGIAVVHKDSAGGTQLGGHQSAFCVDGKPIVVLGDAVAGHPPHPANAMAEASPWMRINGIGVCRQGHRARCSHRSTGRSWFFIPE